MTVTVRPFPKRTYQNGIRPFRPVVPANNIRPYTIKTWRPPVPEPLKPAPLLGPKELLGLGLLVLAQLWGRINSTKPKTYTPTPGGPVLVELPVQGRYDPAGNNIVTRGAFRGTSVIDQYNGTCEASTTPVEYQAQSRTESYPLRNLSISVGGNSQCGIINTGFFLGYGTEAGTRAMGGLPALSGQSGWKDFVFAGWSVQPVNPAAPGLLDASSLAPWDGTVHAPERESVPEVLPQVSPVRPLIPLPVRTVPIPDVEPSVVPTTPGPAAPPATAPPVPRRTVPLPLPGATPTKDGAIVPQAPAPVAVTPPDAHFPVPGAPPVTGNGPRPTPEGIAQELGRLEQKLARLSDPGPEGPGDGSDRLQLLFDLIGRLIEFTTSMTSGGGYSLSSPCELDENGNRIVSTVEYTGAASSFGVLANKIDALAGVLQVHKDLKQPICKQTPAVGQPVTVNFVQVD